MGKAELGRLVWLRPLSEDEKPLKCPNCGDEWFRTAVTLNRAAKVTGHSEPLTCDGCGIIVYPRLT